MNAGTFVNESLWKVGSRSISCPALESVKGVKGKGNVFPLWTSAVPCFRGRKGELVYVARSDGNRGSARTFIKVSA